MMKKKPTKKSAGKKLQIKVKDLKTKKDAKGGAAMACIDAKISASVCSATACST